MKFRFILLLLFVVASPVFAQDAVSPGELVIEHPTLHCLGFEWPIAGDANRNAVVTVAYRKANDPAWRDAQPLLRIGGETVATHKKWRTYVTPHMFAGSIFYLDPDTQYDVRLTMTDPDGGGKQLTVQTTTKTLPVLPTAGDAAKVKTAQAFETAVHKAKPGDQIILAGGVYKGQFDFTGIKGQPGKPIVIRSADGEKAIIEGIKTEWMLRIVDTDYLWFEGLTFRDPGNGDGGHTVEGVVMLGGNARHGHTPGAKHLVVRNCTFEDFGVGVMAVAPDCVGFTITDNYFHGRQHWLAPKTMKNGDYSQHSWVAVWIAGTGHDVAYNYVSGFRDGLNIASGMDRDGDPSKGARSIDFYNNILRNVGDDFLETDTGTHNLRIMNNLCMNTQTCGISAQPIYGGPAYFIGNILHNGPRGVAFKFNVEPAGLFVYHNTVIMGWRNGPTSNIHLQNNLFLSDVQIKTHTEYSTYNHNGFSGSAMVAFTGKDETLDLTTHRQNATIPEGLDVFENVPEPLGKEKEYNADEINAALKPGSSPIDKGTPLANINDGYSGSAPDLGALEQGKATPHFGPRTH